MAASLAAGLTLASPLAAQSGSAGWNDARTLELVQRARDRRQRPVIDSTLRNYRADVSGHIYFFIDREANPEPVLLRADQVALELFWAQPDRVKQVIHGMRSEEQFPIRDFRYYLDRYTVIQNGFDDVIRVGEGRDVRNVIHPLAEPGRHFYDFSLADSTIIRLPTEPAPLRVYEVKVRPRDFSDPGIVGSLYLERARGDLVRLAFTFTPASYIDPRNERVEVMLENALWDGQYWLPREQRLLVRRELPQFDIDVGTVIRAALTVDNYELNTELPPGFFGGREVSMVAGPRALAEYDFDEGLFDGLDDVGLAPGTDPGTLDEVDVEAIAGSIIREQYFRGIPEIRFYAPTGSDILRYGRAQGLVTGAGAVLGIGRSELYGYGGYAWGAGDAVAELGWQPAGRPRGVAWFGRAYLNDPVDLGLRPASAGVTASLSAVVLGNDLRDVAIASGGEVGLSVGDARTGRLTVSAAVERRSGEETGVRRAPFDAGRTFRPLPPLDVLDRLAVQATYERRGALGPFSTRLAPKVEAGVARYPETFAFADSTGPTVVSPVWIKPRRDDGGFARLALDAAASWSDTRRAAGLVLRGSAAFNLGATTYQHLWYVGGRNTLPGHGFHEYVGDRGAVVDVTAWRTVVRRWLRLRLFAAAGWAALDTDAPTPQDPTHAAWRPGPTDGVASSVGIGVGLVDGLLRLDYGLRTDSWDGALILSIEPDLWSFL
ncbi:MAG: hypothetical protein R6U63_05420 [Longimicrobiales bacterium]